MNKLDDLVEFDGTAESISITTHWEVGQTMGNALVHGRRHVVTQTLAEGFSPDQYIDVMCMAFSRAKANAVVVG